MKPVFCVLLLVFLFVRAGAQHLSPTQLEAVYQRHAVVDTQAVIELKMPNYRTGGRTALAGGIVASVGFACIGYLVYGPPHQSSGLFYLGLPLIAGGVAATVTGGTLCLAEALRYKRDYRRATCPKYLKSDAYKRRKMQREMPVAFKKRRTNKIGAYITGGLAATYIADGVFNKHMLENSLHIAGATAAFIYFEHQYIKYNRQCKAYTPHVSLYAGDKGVGLAYNF
jgi:hypothetical protein